MTGLTGWESLREMFRHARPQRTRFRHFRVPFIISREGGIRPPSRVKSSLSYAVA